MEAFWFFTLGVAILVIWGFRASMPFDLDDSEKQKHEKFVEAMSRGRQ